MNDLLRECFSYGGLYGRMLRVKKAFTPPARPIWNP